MKKIISLFQRNYEGDRLVRNEVVPGAEWVIAGEGVATRKWDGTPCLFQGGQWFKRYDVKKGRSVPVDAIPCQDPDPVTFHWPHWIPVSGSPEDKWIKEAALQVTDASDGDTYEAIGPKINGGNDGYPKDSHVMAKHGNVEFRDCPRDFKGLKEWFTKWDGVEGIVWHHPDGRMVKIKRKDFGLPWPVGN